MGPDPRRKSTYSLPLLSQILPSFPRAIMTSLAILPKWPPGSTAWARRLKSSFRGEISISVILYSSAVHADDVLVPFRVIQKMIKRRDIYHYIRYPIF